MYNTSTNYKNTILADSTKHVLKLYIGQRQLEPNHIFDFTMNKEMFSDELYLGATPMKSCSFKIHKDEIHSGDSEIRVVSGIEGEEIPMGTFVFEDIKEVDFFTYEITAVDYMYKFEGAYDTDLDFSEGVTLLEVLNDLCEKSDVVLGSESFLNDDTVIAVYDSTLQRKEYLSYIAEQAGGFAIIGRDNKLYINTFNHTENASELNLNNFKSFKWGQQTSVSKIAYEDGIQDFKKGDDSGSTLWIAQKNMYITSQSQIDNVYDELTEIEREIEEEGTLITIEDSKEGTKIDYSVKGDTTQSGAPTPEAPIEVKNVTGLQKVRVCGKNLLNLSKKKDGYLLGTTIGSPATFLSNAVWTMVEDYIPINYNDKVTLSRKNADNGQWLFAQFDANKNLLARANNTIFNTNKMTYTINNANAKYLMIGYRNDYDYTDLQLEKGSTATTYEKYQGKDYEINLGKNLLDNSISSQTINGVTLIANSDGSVTCNGTASATIIVNLLSSNLILQAGTYTLSGCPSGGSLSSRYKLDIYKSSASSFLTYDSGSGATFTLTEETTFDRVRLVIFGGYTATDLTFYPMIEKSSVATSYSPYFEPIELNKIGNYQDFIRKGTGKNLFDKNNANILNGWLDNNKMALNPTQLNRLFYIPCKANTTYTISRSILTSTFRVATYDSEPFPTIGSSEVQYNISGLIKDNSATSITITTGANAKYLIVHYGRLETDPNIEESLKTIQIEENSQATFYEPYGYKDKWYIEKNVGKVVLNGSRNWTKSGNTNIDRFVLSGYVDYGDTNCFSNYFDNGIYSDTNYTKNQIFLNTYSSTKRIIINYSTVGTTTLAQFKTWLQSNNTKVYYVLATPTYTLIENEELLNQLDELNNATLMEGTTNIGVIGDPSFIMNLDFDVKNRNFYQFEGGSIVDPANDLGDVVIIDKKPVIFEGKMSYLGKWYIDVNSTALVKDKAHSMNTKTDTRAKIRRVESQINQIEGEITQVVEATEEISKDYVTNSEYTTYKTETTQSMSQLSQQVSQTIETLYGENDDGLVKRVEKTETDISQNAEDITLSVGRISSLETKTEELDDNTKKIVKSFKFNDDGLTISNQGSDEDDGANINIDSEDIKIRIGTATKLLINGSGIYYDSASFNKLDLGDFAIVAEENGFLSIIYEGGN